MTKKTIRAGLAVLTLLALSPLPLAAAEIEGVPFEPRISGPPAELVLCSAGVLRYRRVIKLNAAALYLARCADRTRVLDDVPKRLELAYFWSIDAERLVQAAEAFLARNLSEPQGAALRDRVDTLNAAYRGVRPGDRYALTYAPGVGTTLTLNGEALATVPGADFARAYFAIWLGDDPVDAALRRQLLS